MTQRSPGKRCRYWIPSAAPSGLGCPILPLTVGAPLVGVTCGVLVFGVWIGLRPLSARNFRALCKEADVIFVGIRMAFSYGGNYLEEVPRVTLIVRFLTQVRWNH